MSFWAISNAPQLSRTYCLTRGDRLRSSASEFGSEIMCFENVLVVDETAHFPSFCAFAFREDDPSAVAWIDFWAVEPCSNAEADYTRGQKYADEAIWHVRTTGQPAFIEC